MAVMASCGRLVVRVESRMDVEARLASNLASGKPKFLQHRQHRIPECRSAGVSDLESPSSRSTIDGRAANEVKMPECQRTSFHSNQPVMTSSKHFVSRYLEHRCLRNGISIFGIHRAPPLRGAYMMLISFTMKIKRFSFTSARPSFPDCARNERSITNSKETQRYERDCFPLPKPVFVTFFCVVIEGSFLPFPPLLVSM